MRGFAGRSSVAMEEIVIRFPADVMIYRVSLGSQVRKGRAPMGQMLYDRGNRREDMTSYRTYKLSVPQNSWEIEWPVELAWSTVRCFFNFILEDDKRDRLNQSEERLSIRRS